MKRLLIIILFLLHGITMYSQVRYSSAFGDYNIIGDANYPIVRSPNTVYNTNYISYNGGSYYSTYESVSYNSSGPMRAPGSSANGNEVAEVDGVSVSVTWHVKATWLGIVTWTIKYSNGDEETFIGSFEEAQRYASEQAKEKAREEAERLAEERAQSTPIGNVFILLIFSVVYFMIIDKRKRRAVRSPFLL